MAYNPYDPGTGVSPLGLTGQAAFNTSLNDMGNASGAFTLNNTTQTGGNLLTPNPNIQSPAGANSSGGTANGFDVNAANIRNAANASVTPGSAAQQAFQQFGQSNGLSAADIQNLINAGVDPATMQRNLSGQGTAAANPFQNYSMTLPTGGYVPAAGQSAPQGMVQQAPSANGQVGYAYGPQQNPNPLGPPTGGGQNPGLGGGSANGPQPLSAYGNQAQQALAGPSPQGGGQQQNPFQNYQQQAGGVGQNQMGGGYGSYGSGPSPWGGFGGGMGGYNSWGSPFQGNPYAYMTGQPNNGMGMFGGGFGGFGGGQMYGGMGGFGGGMGGMWGGQQPNPYGGGYGTSQFPGGQNPYGSLMNQLQGGNAYMNGYPGGFGGMLGMGAYPGMQQQMGYGGMGMGGYNPLGQMGNMGGLAGLYNNLMY